ncbi:GDP-mannose 4,6-dehydratase [archaeon]|jgi:GDPmannose 4,6-dehydratase|nr:GDP-mannose 4,6-dehydratase [archaeon]MBT4241374.1 GDP-mannose 4,6-dehydratase [archaeon]MBT4418195.1 GDP-mannose 4,6-dehydratase [archaeon]
MDLNKKRVLITGITGQDGAYLAKFLLEKGYEVYGIVRRISTPNYWRLQSLDILDKVILISADLTDMASLSEAIQKSNPEEIYNLAAQSFVGSSFDQPLNTIDVNGLGFLRILEVVRNFNKSIRIYQASTSELFGDSVSSEGIQDEKTSFKPNSPYAAGKLLAMDLARIYRESYDMFVSNGILFNHESELRGLEFVTRKITNEVAKIKLGLSNELHLGNLDAKRDWGYAPDYVESMWMILQQDKPDDFVIATNETHSVREFVEEAFRLAGLDWREYVKTNEQFKRPYDVRYLKGDYSKANNKFGWKPKTTFKELVKKMFEEDLNRWQRHFDGEVFAWDAINHPGNIKFLYKSKNK